MEGAAGVSDGRVGTLCSWFGVSVPIYGVWCVLLQVRFSDTATAAAVGKR